MTLRCCKSFVRFTSGLTGVSLPGLRPNPTRLTQGRCCHAHQPLTLCDVEQETGIATVTLNNPKKRNALSSELMTSLHGSLQSIGEQWPQVKVVILKALGPVFSSGHDLKELARIDQEGHVKVFEQCSQLMVSIQNIKQPVIAQVAGLATAAGAQLAASCDLIVSSTDSAFETPGVKVGLFCSTPSVPISRGLPHKVVMEMLLTAEPLTAERAYSLGFVNKIAPREELDEATRELALKVTRFSSVVIGLGKRGFYEHSRQQDIRKAYGLAGDLMVENLQLKECQHGIDSFISKKPPKW